MASVDSGVETGNESNDGSLDAKTESPTEQLSDFGPMRRRKLAKKYYDNPKKFRIYWSDIPNGLVERKLRIAVTTNNIELVQNYLFSGVDPNCVDSMGRSPLHLAASSGYADIVRLLLENGANPNQRDRLGKTPLHIAACTNNIVVVTFLLQAGTDVCSSDLRGLSPLQLAQSKLKLLQRHMSGDGAAKDYVRNQASQVSSSKSLHHSDKLPVYDNTFVANQALQIVEMMRLFLQKRGQESEAELLSAFSSRLTLSDTKEQVETQVRDLLDNLSSLSLDSTSAIPNINKASSSFNSFNVTPSSSEVGLECENFFPPRVLLQDCLSFKFSVKARPEDNSAPDQPKSKTDVPKGWNFDFT